MELHRQGIGTGTASVIKSESYFLYMRELIAPLGAAVEGRSSADSAGGGKRCSCTVRQEDNRLSSTVHDESDLGIGRMCDIMSPGEDSSLYLYGLVMHVPWTEDD